MKHTKTDAVSSLVMVSVSESTKNAVIDLLNRVLASMLDLKLQTKQAHWNVKGENFISVHELFDKLATDVDEYADILAERVMQLDGMAQGTLQAIANTSVLPVYPTHIAESQKHLNAIATAIGLVEKQVIYLAEVSAQERDIVTADICTGIADGLAKQHWFIRSHIKPI